MQFYIFIYIYIPTLTNIFKIIEKDNNKAKDNRRKTH